MLRKAILCCVIPVLLLVMPVSAQERVEFQLSSQEHLIRPWHEALRTRIMFDTWDVTALYSQRTPRFSDQTTDTLALRVSKETDQIGTFQFVARKAENTMFSSAGWRNDRFGALTTVGTRTGQETQYYASVFGTWNRWRFDLDASQEASVFARQHMRSMATPLERTKLVGQQTLGGTLFSENAIEDAFGLRATFSTDTSVTIMRVASGDEHPSYVAAAGEAFTDYSLGYRFTGNRWNVRTEYNMRDLDLVTRARVIVDTMYRGARSEFGIGTYSEGTGASVERALTNTYSTAGGAVHGAVRIRKPFMLGVWAMIEDDNGQAYTISRAVLFGRYKRTEIGIGIRQDKQSVERFTTTETGPLVTFKMPMQRFRIVGSLSFIGDETRGMIGVSYKPQGAK